MLVRLPRKDWQSNMNVVHKRLGGVSYEEEGNSASDNN